MKFLYLIALLAFIQLVVCDSFVFQFNSVQDANDCMAKNSAYITKVSKERNLYGSVLYLNLNNSCDTSSGSISDNVNYVCGKVAAQHCYRC